LATNIYQAQQRFERVRSFSKQNKTKDAKLQY